MSRFVREYFPLLVSVGSAVAAGASMSSAYSANKTVETIQRSVEANQRQNNAIVTARLMKEYNDPSFTKMISDHLTKYQVTPDQSLEKVETAAWAWGQDLKARRTDALETARVLRQVYSFYSEILFFHKMGILPTEVMKECDLPGIPRTRQFIEVGERLYRYHPKMTTEPRHIRELCSLLTELGGSKDKMPDCCT